MIRPRNDVSFDFLSFRRRHQRVTDQINQIIGFIRLRFNYQKYYYILRVSLAMPEFLFCTRREIKSKSGVGPTRLRLSSHPTCRFQ
jgi:hypothetical protein